METRSKKTLGVREETEFGTIFARDGDEEQRNSDEFEVEGGKCCDYRN